MWGKKIVGKTENKTRGSATGLLLKIPPPRCGNKLLIATFVWSTGIGDPWRVDKSLQKEKKNNQLTTQLY